MSHYLRLADKKKESEPVFYVPVTDPEWRRIDYARFRRDAAEVPSDLMEAFWQRAFQCSEDDAPAWGAELEIL